MANQLITSMSRRELLVGATAATAQLRSDAGYRSCTAQKKCKQFWCAPPRSGYMAPTGQASVAP